MKRIAQNVLTERRTTSQVKKNVERVRELLLQSPRKSVGTSTT